MRTIVSRLLLVLLGVCLGWLMQCPIPELLTSGASHWAIMAEGDNFIELAEVDSQGRKHGRMVRFDGYKLCEMRFAQGLLVEADYFDADGRLVQRAWEDSETLELCYEFLDETIRTSEEADESETVAGLFCSHASAEATRDLE